VEAAVAAVLVAETVAVVEVDGEALMARRPCETRALSLYSLSLYSLSLFLFLPRFVPIFLFSFINYLNFQVSLEK